MFDMRLPGYYVNFRVAASSTFLNAHCVRFPTPVPGVVRDFLCAGCLLDSPVTLYILCTSSSGRELDRVRGSMSVPYRGF